MAKPVKRYFDLLREIKLSPQPKFVKAGRAIKLQITAIVFLFEYLKFYNLRFREALQPVLRKINDRQRASVQELGVRYAHARTGVYPEITIILPIYGQLRLVAKLSRTISSQVEAGVNLVVVDDAKDEYSTEWISKHFANWPNTKVITNKVNLGYLKSVNKAYEGIGTKYVLLLNSDTQLPEGWAERLVNSLEATGACLATPVATNSGGNLTLEHPTSLSWRQADGILAQMTPMYPNAATAIGYCLFIDRVQLDEGNLFSEDYLDGYGEDSDLHYRVVTSGKRSIVVDNLLIKHESGASYNTKGDVESIRRLNHGTFLAKWESQHLTELKIWNSEKPLKRLQGRVRNNSKADKYEFDIVIVLPTIERTAGGISLVLELAEEIEALGARIAIVSMTRVKSSVAVPVFEKKDFWKISKIKTVIATGIGTFDLTTALAKRFDAKQTLFFQGPELFFDNGIHQETFAKFLSTSDLVVCVSSYLKALAQTFTSCKIVESPFGPDIESYYTSPRIRENIAVVSSRLNFEKGTVFSVPLAEHLISSGWRVVSIGPTHPSLKNIRGMEHLGSITAEEMRNLFNQAKILIDTSIFEGMGLVPLEAIACGCVPIMNPKGGTESLIKDSKLVEWLPSPIVNLVEFERHVQSAVSKLDHVKSGVPEQFRVNNLHQGLVHAANEIIRSL